MYAGGRFTLVNNVPRGALAALDAQTGAVRTDFVNNITGGIGTNGELAVQRLKLTRDEGRLLVVHTGRQVNGQNRYGIAIINTRTNKLTPWKTTLWEDNLQFVGGIQRIYGGDISPDGTKFVVSSGSGGDRPPINDTVIVFNLEQRQRRAAGVDLPALRLRVLRHLDRGRASTSAATSSGPRTSARRSRGRASTTSGYGTGQGLSAYALGDVVVKRFHLAALDPADGHALEWFAPSNSYEGDKHIEATPRGLFVGGDGNTKGGFNVGRIAFFDFDERAGEQRHPDRDHRPDRGPHQAGRRGVRDHRHRRPRPAASTGSSSRSMDRNTGRYLADDLHHVGQHDAQHVQRDPGPAPGPTAPGGCR